MKITDILAYSVGRYGKQTDGENTIAVAFSEVVKVSLKRFSIY